MSSESSGGNVHGPGYQSDEARESRDRDWPWILLTTLKKVVSGAQTGVDQGALDAALAINFPCGGWCTAGRKSEEGPIPGRYPVNELAGASYPERTKRNIGDSDGTLILYDTNLSGGTALTASVAESLSKPCLAIDLGEDAKATVASIWS